MPVSSSEIKQYQPATPASSFSTSNVGGAISATEITGASTGEVFFTMAANSSGGGTRTQYAKSFVKNNNTTSDLTSTVIYVANSLDVVVSNGTVSVVSDSASDGSSKFVRVIGYDGSSAAQTEDITLNGTTTTTGALTFSKVHRVELRLVSGSALTTASGNITITRGSALGILPAGYRTVTAEVDFGLEATLNGSTTITDASTDPGVTFARPNTAAEGTAVANSGSLTSEDAQAIWWRWQLAELASPSSEVQVVVGVRGITS